MNERTEGILQRLAEGPPVLSAIEVRNAFKSDSAYRKWTDNMVRRERLPEADFMLACGRVWLRTSLMEWVGRHGGLRYKLAGRPRLGEEPQPRFCLFQHAGGKLFLERKSDPAEVRTGLDLSRSLAWSVEHFEELELADLAYFLRVPVTLVAQWDYRQPVWLGGDAVWSSELARFVGVDVPAPRGI